MFFGLALDEAILIHEALIGPVRDLTGASGLLTFAWVLPAIGLLLGLMIDLAAPLRSLSLWDRFQALFAAVCYVAGAVLIEMLGAQRFSEVGTQLDLPFLLMTSV